MREFCPKGHAWIHENLRVGSRGSLECKVCNRERERRKRVRQSRLRVCDVCGRSFERKGTTDARCSAACRREAQRRYMVEYTAKNRAKRNKRVQAWRTANREKANAEARVQKAVKAGRLVKQSCEVGVDCAGPIHAHHDDYSKPLDVRWLCRKHHRQVHTKGSSVYVAVG